LTILTGVKNTLETASEKDFNWIINDLSSMQDELLDQKENIVDPIIKFMEGNQKIIYENARQFLLNNRDNLSSLDSKNARKITEILDDENCYKNNQIQNVNSLVTELETAINKARLSAVETSLANANNLFDQIKSMNEYQSANEQIRLNIDNSFRDLQGIIKDTVTVDMVSIVLDRFKKETFPKLVSSLGGSSVTEVISSTAIKFKHTKSVLETEADVNEYIDEYKQALKEEISKGKRITV